ncbi:chloride channel protein [Cryobacterium algoritolerans]|uniref:chloride channel protein n=1 Tax=Cryobacterium algoritolerans TaxID=1259184 RepID=UPI00141AA32A|nr:chloride channel protein [Cryobacterium algoritolerans]
MPHLTSTPSLLVWSVLAGPVLGIAAVGFVRLAHMAEDRRPRGRGILIGMPPVFAAVGLVSVALPAILGNGRSLRQIAFDATVPIGLVALLLAGKVAVTIATIGSGAAGGTLTPSLAFRAVTGGLWDLVWPGIPPAAFAFIAAARFLAAAMRAPLTALVLVLEFTHEGPSLVIPMLLATSGAVLVAYLLGRRRNVEVD